MFASIGVNAQKFITANVADALMACSAASMTNGANSSSSSQRGGNSGRGTSEIYLDGSFRYKGANYGFSLKIYYATATGKITSVYYAPHATNKFSKISGDIWFSNEGIYIDGKTADGVKTYINAASYGTSKITGDMRRGNHSGTCVIYK